MDPRAAQPPMPSNSPRRSKLGYWRVTNACAACSTSARALHRLHCTLPLIGPIGPVGFWYFAHGPFGPLTAHLHPPALATPDARR